MVATGVDSIAVLKPLRVGNSLEDDFIVGMSSKQKFLPPKYFYDELGSHLFDQICDVPEYYPTRAEDELLKEISFSLITDLKPDAIFELGSGTARKTRRILDACESANCFPDYHPIDVCPEILIMSKEELSSRYDWLSVHPMVGDYMKGFTGFKNGTNQNLFLFLGGTIGNLTESESLLLLREVRGLMKPNDSLLLGADLVKSPDLLHAAYNDSDGVTAKFNLNLLAVLNKRLGGDFRLENFVHHAIYNPVKFQIEMYLVCVERQEVYLKHLNKRIHFQLGDSILTEVSRKFTKARLENLFSEAGLDVVSHFESRVPEFALVHAKPNKK